MTRRLAVLVPLLAVACSDNAATSATDAAAPATTVTAPVAQDVLIDDPQAFPENVTSLADGTLIVGGTLGRVFRAGPDETTARVWIEATPENGLGSVLGVLADEASGVLLVCSNPDLFTPGAEGVTQVMAFDLQSGERTGAWPFPANEAGAQGVCNDIAVADDGVIYAVDTPGGRILTLTPGGQELKLFGQDPLLVGVDGIAFADDGTLYVNNVQQNTLIRVGFAPDDVMGELTLLELSHPLSGPDGMRSLGGNSFLLGEGGGRVSKFTVTDDRADFTVLREGMDGSVGVTLARGVAYAIEGQIGYRINPDLRGQTPPPFTVHAIPLEP